MGRREEEVNREAQLERLIIAFLLVNDIDRERIAEMRQCDCLSCRIMAAMYNEVEDAITLHSGEYIH